MNIKMANVALKIEGGAGTITVRFPVSECHQYETQNDPGGLDDLMADGPMAINMYCETMKPEAVLEYETKIRGRIAKNNALRRDIEEAVAKQDPIPMIDVPWPNQPIGEETGTNTSMPPEETISEPDQPEPVGEDTTAG